MNAIILDHSSVTKTVIDSELNFPDLNRHFFSDPLDALEFLKKEKTYLLTTSMELSNLNGLELISKIRKDGNDDLLIVLITSYTDIDFFHTSYISGVDLLITKNFNKGDLYRCFQRIITPSLKMDKILIVDDSSMIRMLYVRSLRNSNYTILEADSAESALDILYEKGDEIVLILSDEHMGGITGSELCYRIRRNTPFASMPFILVSSEDGATLQKKSQESYINYFITKPAEREEILMIADQYRKEWISHRKDLRTVLPLLQIQTSSAFE